MNEWTEIRRRFFVDKVSKRSIVRDYGLSWRTLDKILENAEPPGYRGAERRPKRKLTEALLGEIDAILEADREAPVKQRTPHGGSSSGSVTSTATPAASPRCRKR